MSQRWIIGITIFLASVSFCLTGGQAAEQMDTAAIEKAVLDTYAEITKAAESVDGEKLFSYVLENDKGSMISNGKIVLTRQQGMDNYVSSIGNVTAIDYMMNKQYVTVISPETAIMVAEGRYEGKTVDGQTFGTPMAQTVVFVLRENQWKVLHSHTSVPVDR